MSTPAPRDALVFVGTYTQPLPHVDARATGIDVHRMDGATGTLTHLGTTTGIANPSFLTLDAQRALLFAVQEIDQFDGQPGGAVSAYSIDVSTGRLALINQQPTHGVHPCYVSTDRSGRWLLTANYGSGSVSVLPIGADGALGPATAVTRHSGPANVRGAAHTHAILEDPAGAFVLVPDCGLDRIYVYRLDTAGGTLEPHDPPWAALPREAAPRHLAFHPAGGYVYCITESASTIVVFAYDTLAGALREIQTVSTLPPDGTGRNACADIHVHPSGRFLYGSNRGHDSIAIFAIDPATGLLSPRGHVPSGGRTPRNFAIDPSGTFLLAANQDSDTIVTFHIDTVTGALDPGPVNHSPTPVCLQLFRV